ncbi:rho guanine nucleotide exchange factor 40-like isoform X2 [Carcharodon carcharias]|uniref:rho guanine nucleotide exchange factor 40-like isoform X2 n=1 Tax=Carcharodon carcharias TaxID=13397 RepID=UPI001B7F18C5|nr:rho guanine nucleotide exchange factor 40-like isoform X2 [Carcharodon carcharias]
MESEAVDSCIQRSLAALYPPFEDTAASLLGQVFDVLERTFGHDTLRYVLDFFIPAKRLLEAVQQRACAHYDGCLFLHQGWPLCLGEQLVLQLSALDWRALQPEDFYLQVAPLAAGGGRDQRGARLLLKYLDDDPGDGGGGVKELTVPESSYPHLFTVEWLEGVNRSLAPAGGLLRRHRLDCCLLASPGGRLRRVRWRQLVYPRLLSASGGRPRLSGDGAASEPEGEERGGSANGQPSKRGPGSGSDVTHGPEARAADGLESAHREEEEEEELDRLLVLLDDGGEYVELLEVSAGPAAAPAATGAGSRGPSRPRARTLPASLGARRRGAAQARHWAWLHHHHRRRHHHQQRRRSRVRCAGAPEWDAVGGGGKAPKAYGSPTPAGQWLTSHTSLAPADHGEDGRSQVGRGLSAGMGVAGGLDWRESRTRMEGRTTPPPGSSHPLPGGGPPPASSVLGGLSQRDPPTLGSPDRLPGAGWSPDADGVSEGWVPGCCMCVEGKWPGTEPSLPHVDNGTEPSLANAETGTQLPMAEAETGTEPSLANAETGTQPSLPHVDNGTEPSLAKAETGTQLPLAEAETGTEPSLAYADNGTELSLAKVETGTDHSLAKAETGTEPSLAEAKSGTEPTLAKVAAGTEPSLAKAETGTELSLAKVATGSEPSLANAGTPTESPLAKMNTGTNSSMVQAETGTELSLVKVETRTETPLAQAETGTELPFAKAETGTELPLTKAVNETEPSLARVDTGTEPSLAKAETAIEPSLANVETGTELSLAKAETGTEPSLANMDTGTELSLAKAETGTEPSLAKAETVTEPSLAKVGTGTEPSVSKAGSGADSSLAKPKTRTELSLAEQNGSIIGTELPLAEQEKSAGIELSLVEREKSPGTEPPSLVEQNRSIIGTEQSLAEQERSITGIQQPLAKHEMSTNGTEFSLAEDFTPLTGAGLSLAEQGTRRTETKQSVAKRISAATAAEPKMDGAPTVVMDPCQASGPPESSGDCAAPPAAAPAEKAAWKEEEGGDTHRGYQGEVSRSDVVTDGSSSCSARSSPDTEEDAEGSSPPSPADPSPPPPTADTSPPPPPDTSPHVSSLQPLCAPSHQPASALSYQLPDAPSHQPPNAPSHQTPNAPSHQPPQAPSHQPPDAPSHQPPDAPSHQPPDAPSHQTTQAPSHQPPNAPSHQPLNAPSHQPPNAPSHQPPQAPSHQPPQGTSHQPPDAPSHQLPQAPPHQSPNAPSHQPPQAPSHQPPQGTSHQPPDAPSHQLPQAPPHQSPNALSHQSPDVPSHQQPQGTSHQPTNAPSHQTPNAPSHQPPNAPSHQPPQGTSHQPPNAPSHQTPNAPSHQPPNAPSHQPPQAPPHHSSDASSLRPVGFGPGDARGKVQKEPSSQDQAIGCYPTNLLNLDLDILHSGVLSLPGNRDRNGRALVVVTTKSAIWETPKCLSTEVARILIYYYTISKKETQNLGLRVLIDAHDCWPAAVLFRAFHIFLKIVHGGIHSVLILAGKEPSVGVEGLAGLQVDILTSIRSLHKHVEPAQLTQSFSGCFPYSNEKWIRYRLRLESLLHACRASVDFLRSTSDQLEAKQLPKSAKDVSALIEEDRMLMCRVLRDARLIGLQQEGAAILVKLRRETVSMGGSEDFTPDMELTCALYDQVDEEVHRLVQVSNRRQKDLEDLDHFWRFEDQFQEVSHWLKNMGQPQLDKCVEMGDSLPALRKKQQEFQDFNHRALEYCQKAQGLLRDMTRWEAAVSPQLGACAQRLRGYRAQLADFTERAEQCRLTIDRTIRLHEFFQAADSWASGSTDSLAGVSVERSLPPGQREAALAALDSRFQEMRRLAEELAAGRWLGRWAACREAASRASAGPGQRKAPEGAAGTPRPGRGSPCQPSGDPATSPTLSAASLGSSSGRLSAPSLGSPGPEGPARAPLPWRPGPLGGASSPPLAHASSPDVRGSPHTPPAGGSAFSRRSLSEPGGTVPGGAGVLIRGLEVSSREVVDRTCSPREHVMLARAGAAAPPIDAPWGGAPRIGVQAKSSKLRRTLAEALAAEQEYVGSLARVVEDYLPEMDRPDAPQDLRGKRGVVFGNLEKLLAFHRQRLLPELRGCLAHPLRLGECFLRHKEQFSMYALYVKNKAQLDALLASHSNTFFERKQLLLGDRTGLAGHLQKPIQRMRSYSLLLQELTGQCEAEATRELLSLRAAVDMVQFQLRHGNNLLAMDAIRGCDVNLKEQGQLLRQDSFTVSAGRRKSTRHVFLFEQLIVFSKLKRADGCPETFIYKSSLKTADVGLTENIGDTGLRFELWFRRRQSHEAYVFQAESADVKQAWTRDIAQILWRQASRNKEMRLREMVSMGMGSKLFLDVPCPADQTATGRAESGGGDVMSECVPRTSGSPWIPVKRRLSRGSERSRAGMIIFFYAVCRRLQGPNALLFRTLPPLLSSPAPQPPPPPPPPLHRQPPW